MKYLLFLVLLGCGCGPSAVTGNDVKSVMDTKDAYDACKADAGSYAAYDACKKEAGLK